MKTKLKEITLARLKPPEYIRDQVAALRATVGDGIAINALSGGVDSAVVTMLAHRALGERLKTYFIDNGLMRADEPETVVKLFVSAFGGIGGCAPRVFHALKGKRPGSQASGYH